MDCADEETLIRRRLSRLREVHRMEFDLVTRTVSVTHETAFEPVILEALAKLGMPASGGATSREVADAHALDAQPVTDAHAAPTLNVHADLLADWKRLIWWRVGIAAAAALIAEVLELTGAPGTAILGLAVLAVLVAGLETYWKGIIALRHGVLSMKTLMSIAVTGAFVVSAWPEAAMVMVLFALAELIEERSLDHARDAIRKLMEVAPQTATVRDGAGDWRETLSADVPVDAIVRVRPGERVALDGIVLEGSSTVDQAPITGESVPVEKAAGDQVYAGTVNQGGELICKVTAQADDSTIARIIHVVQEAQSSRAPTQRFVDRFARVYAPAVFVGALLVAMIPPLAMGEAWHVWIYRALVLLVIACPCALVISTPVTIASGLASAARNGMLIKGGAHLEQGRRLKTLALDKTGTLTVGRPAVVSAMALNGQSLVEALGIAAALSSRSDHPVSRAVATYAAGEAPASRDIGAGNPISPADVRMFEALPGRGVHGWIEGRSYNLGNHRLVHEVNHCSPVVEDAMLGLEAEGRTAIALMGEQGVEAVFGVADAVRETSHQAIAELRALGIRPVMLTGDNRVTAVAVAGPLGIDDVRAELLPEEKLSALHGLTVGRGAVGMVGDGINDAPALAAADIGFAMGVAGSDTALETADVALMDDDLRKVPAFVRLSRRTADVLAQNIALALGIKAIFLALAVTGGVTMWMAVFADMGATLIVVFNGMRLLGRQQARFAAGSQSEPA